MSYPPFQRCSKAAWVASLATGNDTGTVYAAAPMPYLAFDNDHFFNFVFEFTDI